MKEQELRQRQLEQDERDEARKIEEFAEQKRLFEARLEAEKRAKEEEKKKIYENMVAATNERNKEADELEYLRNEL